MPLTSGVSGKPLEEDAAIEAFDEKLVARGRWWFADQ
jgi:hypothetical protein